MTAQHLIAHDIPALDVNQTGRDAYHLLSDYHVKHLPVVDGRRLVGIISEEDVFNHKLYEPVSDYDFTTVRRFSVRSDEHLFDIIRIMGENRLTVIPVVDSEDNYLGMVSQNMLLRTFANSVSFAEPGAVLVLEMTRRDYSLALIARLVEEEDAKLLTSIITTSEDPEMMEVAIKINRSDLSRITASLERQGFVVKESFGVDAYTDGMKERYDSFLAYMNV